jgi:ketosteroid isomerase-like protein
MSYNLDTAKIFLAAMAGGDAGTIARLLDPGVLWCLPNSLTKFGYPTDTRGSDAVVSIASNFALIFVSAKGEILSAAADGDTVGCLVRIHGDTRDGRVYDNLYTFWLRFRDGLIIEGREMTDTSFAAEFFGLKPL